MTPQPWDLVVVGAGVVGTFHALAAGRAGLRTLLLERNDWPRDASVRNFGMVIPSGVEAGEWHDRALASAAIWRGLGAEGAIPEPAVGMQYLATTELEEQVLREFAALGPGHDYRCEFLGAKASAEANPALCQGGIRASLVFPDDLVLDVRRLFPRLIGWMTKRLPVTYRPLATVAGLAWDGGGVAVALAGGERILATRAVLCPGADLRGLAPELVAAHGISWCKLQMLRTVPQPGAQLRIAVGSGLSVRRYDSFALAPSHAALRAAPAPSGSDRFGIHVLAKQEADGALVLGDSHQSPPDPAAYTAELDGEIDDLIVANARPLLQLDTWQVAARWHGVYPTHPTLPALVAPLDEGIDVVAILGGKGMTCAPALAAERVAAMFG